MRNLSKSLLSIDTNFYKNHKIEQLFEHLFRNL